LFFALPVPWVITRGTVDQSIADYGKGREQWVKTLPQMIKSAPRTRFGSRTFGPAAFGFAGAGALFVDDARGDFLCTAFVTAGAFKFFDQCFVFPLPFWTCASWHSVVLSRFSGILRRVESDQSGCLR
jgi:hypothetical protein